MRAGLEGALLAGVAAHHAGCLPAWKSLVERCFQRGENLSLEPMASVRCHTVPWIAQVSSAPDVCSWAVASC